MPTLSKHFFKLSSKWKLYYYSTIKYESKDDTLLFLIIYFHWFPGSGLEEKFCSDSTLKAKSRIYSLKIELSLPHKTNKIVDKIVN